MDSMKSLNTSLHQQNRRQRDHPELLAGLREAALSLQTFYRSAISESRTARGSGYKDALEELLNYLDQENFGLRNGEGASIRHWVTARLENVVTTSELSQPDSDDDSRPEVEGRARSSSPVLQTKPRNTETSSAPLEVPMPSQPRVQSLPPMSAAAVARNSAATQPQTLEGFSFTIPHHACFNMDVEQGGVVDPQAATTPTKQSTAPTAPVSPSVRSTNTSRPAKSKHSSTPTSRRSTNSALATGGGSKRRNPFSEIFDFDLGAFKDGPIGGAGAGGRAKRSKH